MAASSPQPQSTQPQSTATAPANTNDPGVDQVIEADDAAHIVDDGDSALGQDTESSTASISSSILQYRTIHGRRFHSERGGALYWGSNDEAQSEVMDIAHHMWTLAMGGKLCVAPLSKNIQRVLDVGCGTGMWAIDFADEYPNCEVIGTDVSPIQPSWIPPNVKFEIDDCTQDWTFGENTFDYIHIRYLVGAIPDWTALFKQAYRALKPGGILESFEASANVESDDGTVTPEMATSRWGPLFIEGGKKIGRSFNVVPDNTQVKAMGESGFEDLHEWNFKCPMNPWPKDPKMKEMGHFGEVFATQDTEGFLTFVSSVLGWSREELNVYIAHLRRELHDRRNHAYFRVRSVWARKPGGDPVSP